MKKIFTLILVFVAAGVYAQDSVNITFFVNTKHISVDAGGMHIAGGTTFGSPGTNLMTDADGGGVYEWTTRQPKGFTDYFTIANGACPDWSCKENIGGLPCANPDNFNDRKMVNVQNDTVLLMNYGNCSSDTTEGPAAAPAAAASAPEFKEANVISLFSNAYTDVTVGTWRTGWSNGDFEDIQVGTNDVKKYSNLSFVGIEPGAGNFINASEMTHFNLDIWSPDATEFKVKLVDFGADGSYQGGDDTEHELIFTSPTQSEWVNLYLDLDSFINLSGKTNIAQIIFAAGPSGAATVYVDNILFHKLVPDAEPTTAAADPTDKEADVISLFSNVYTDATVDTWKTSWSNATLEDIQVDGNDVKKYSSLDFVGIEAVAGNSIDASDMEHITFDAWTPNATTYRIKLVDFGADNAFGGGDDSEHEVAIEGAATETWNNHKIALADMTGLKGTSNISQIIFSALPTGGATLYLDNIYFSKPETNGITEASFNSFKMYPNPVNDNLNLDIATNGININSYEILSSHGQVLNVTSVNSSSINSSMDLSNYTSGIYFLKINTENGTLTQRFIKN
ncbi:MAG: T9SS type A sorting domain-containing protein [Bacteroidia bacterium]